MKVVRLGMGVFYSRLIETGGHAKRFEKSDRCGTLRNLDSPIFIAGTDADFGD